MVRGPYRELRPGLDCSGISRILFPLSRMATIYLTRFRACPAVLLQVRLIPEDFFPLSRKSERATRSSALSCTAWGLSCDPACARTRWALTPPFHPYPAPFWALIRHDSGRPTAKMVRGGIFSGTLSVTRGLLPGSPRFREACRPMVFGLSSGRLLKPASDRLPRWRLYHSQSLRARAFRARGSEFRVPSSKFGVPGSASCTI